jgi:hypothetical protein
MFIKYYKVGGHEYARLLEAKRDENGGRYDILNCHLGRVIDKKSGIFKSRECGTYKYSLHEGFSDIEDPKVYQENTYGSKLELILDFGAEYVFTEALKKDGIWDVFSSILPTQTDTLLTLVLHSMLWSEARQYAEDFWRTTYARIAFPNAKLKSQRISEFLAKLGDEAVFRSFFETYLTYVTHKSKTSKHSILIDSTGLPNDSHMELTALNIHNGEKSNEIRLILAVDRISGYPLYFRYVKGNILGVSSLANTITALAQYGIEVDHCILDAGYYCGDNIEDLDYWKIPYLLRLRAGNILYRDLIKSHVDGLDTYKNRVLYGSRVVFIKCVPIDFHGNRAFAYVAIDLDAQADERRRIYKKPPTEFSSDADRDEQLRNCGVFILVSKIQVTVNEILPLYYSRQAIEQTFDFEKNYANLLPLRTHSEPTFRGHLLISFMATVSIMTIDRAFILAHPKAKNKNPFNFIQARSCLRQMKCSVYDDHISVLEPDRKSNDILKAMKIKCDRSIKR